LPALSAEDHPHPGVVGFFEHNGLHPNERSDFSCAFVGGNGPGRGQQVLDLVVERDAIAASVPLAELTVSRVLTAQSCAGYFLRDVASFSRFYVCYAMDPPLLRLAEASRLGHLFSSGAFCASLNKLS